MRKFLYFFTIIVLVAALCYTCVGCAIIKNKDKGSKDSGISTGYTDTQLDASDVFGEESNVSNSEESSSALESDSSSESGEEEPDNSDESQSSESEPVNSSNPSSSIDYEDKNAWTKPVGGQR